VSTIHPVQRSGKTGIYAHRYCAIGVAMNDDKTHPNAACERCEVYHSKAGCGWLVTHDMATDAPGARMYHGGYVFGNDAVDEGFKQTIAGLDAGGCEHPGHRDDWRREEAKRKENDDTKNAST